MLVIFGSFKKFEKKLSIVIYFLILDEYFCT